MEDARDKERRDRRKNKHEAAEKNRAKKARDEVGYNKFDHAKVARTVWVGQIGAEEADETAIADLASKCGTVEQVHLRRKGNKSWALVTFAKVTSVSAAVGGIQHLGDNRTRRWKCNPIDPSLIGSFEAHFVLAGFQVAAGNEPAGSGSAHPRCAVVGRGW